MIGVDTTFLVQLEIRELDAHEAAASLLTRQLRSAGRFALTAQVIHEFLHIVTDGKRFREPLAMPTAIAKAQHWWNATEVTVVHPVAATMDLFFEWMGQYSLGRKRILDTYLAATYVSGGVTTIVTSNARDFGVFPELEIMHL